MTVELAELDCDVITAAWVRNPSDEMAVRNGCRFDVERAAFAVWWIENYCRLYEGDAGGVLRLVGCHECDYGLPEIEDWDDEGQAISYERAERHCQCVAAGHHVDWQYECVMRMFGWVRWSNHWKKEVRRFRKASIWVAKKNKKSPTLAALGLYLLIGDNEPGQKVFLAAKDGKQVRDNTAKHTFEMLAQSEALGEQCTPNKTMMSVTHEPSRSVMMPLSSSNVNTKNSKEGLNGCVLIDETHVVDRDFISIINRAGISRPEPMHGEFSTAGNDQDSYGKEQFDTAVRIVSGEVEDQATFAAVYAAPQDLTDEALEKDPLKYGRMANPAMGHTVNPEEFLDDYRQSKASPLKLAQFKMYRLNIWNNSASPFLKDEHWMQGNAKCTYDGMKGKACWAGSDFSTVQDMTAFSLCFPEEGGAFSFLWWFWLPEQTVEKYRMQIPILNWIKETEDKGRCRLIITPGSSIDYASIRDTVRDLSKEYDIRELLFDAWNAEKVTQEISEGIRDTTTGEELWHGTGIPREKFSQSLNAMNEPTKRFEEKVRDGMVWHTGDPIMRWMVGNATIKPDANNNYKPLKTHKGSVKKIDGLIAAIMAQAGAERGNGVVNWYVPGELAL